MSPVRRRRVDLIVFVIIAAIAGLFALFGALIGNPERIVLLQVIGGVRTDGTTKVTEIIDYEFGGGQQRHGIYREIPGMVADVSVTRDGAPDQIDLTASTADGPGTMIRIGRADSTISGRHRYAIQYTIAGLTSDGTLAWDVVGTRWNVPIDRAVITIVTGGAAQTSCERGGVGSTTSCAVRIDGNTIRADVRRLEKYQGVTIRSNITPAGESEAIAALADPADGSGLLLPALVAMIGSFLAMLGIGVVAARRGRDRVAVGGAVDAAFANSTTGGERRVDAADLAAMAAVEFEPPRELKPYQGGALFAEKVSSELQVAWLMQQAIDDVVEITTDDGTVTVAKKGLPAPDATAIFNDIFSGRDEVTLGKYDQDFASGWTKIHALIEGEMRAVPWWDPVGDRRRRRWRVIAGLAILPAVIGIIVIVALAARSGRTQALVAAAVTGGLFGLCFGALLRSWELRIRTPEASGLWLRIESFRRFLHDSEASHVETAARLGLLREYTAWAIALGETAAWSRSVAAAGLPPSTAGLSYVMLGNSLSSATMHSATAPSSSSGGSGFSGGGGVGGGGGGGGGGSW